MPACIRVAPEPDENIFLEIGPCIRSTDRGQRECGTCSPRTLSILGVTEREQTGKPSLEFAQRVWLCHTWAWDHEECTLLKQPTCVPCKCSPRQRVSHLRTQDSPEEEPPGFSSCFPVPFPSEQTMLGKLLCSVGSVNG